MVNVKKFKNSVIVLRIITKLQAFTPAFSNKHTQKVPMICKMKNNSIKNCMYQ